LIVSRWIVSELSPALLRPRGAAVHGAVRRAAEFLDRHWERRVTLDELSRAAYMSKFHLLRRFKEDMGVTPGQYQVLMRLARARTLLQDGVRVSAVAHRTGFSDQSHLTRAFKRIYGVTPARFAGSVAGRTEAVAWPLLDASAGAAPDFALAA
jgi:AraC-like DNA-binding protein